MKKKSLLTVFLIFFLIGCSHADLLKKTTSQNKAVLNGTSLFFIKPVAFSLSQQDKQFYNKNTGEKLKLSVAKVYPSDNASNSIQINKVINFKSLSKYYSALSLRDNSRVNYLKINNNDALEAIYESKIHARTVNKGNKTYKFINHLFIMQADNNLYKCSLKSSKKAYMQLKTSFIDICKSMRITP